MHTDTNNSNDIQKIHHPKSTQITSCWIWTCYGLSKQFPDCLVSLSFSTVHSINWFWCLCIAQPKMLHQPKCGEIDAENMRVFQCFFSAGLCHLCHSMHFLSLFVLIRDFVWWSRKKSEQPHAYLMMYKLNDSSTEQRSYIWFMKPTQMSHHFTLRPVQLGPIFFYLLSLKFNIMHFKANAHFFRSSVPKLCSVYVCYVILHVKSYTFHYLFVHRSFVYFSIDYHVLLAQNRFRGFR